MEDKNNYQNAAQHGRNKSKPVAATIDMHKISLASPTTQNLGFSAGLQSPAQGSGANGGSAGGLNTIQKMGGGARIRMPTTNPMLSLSVGNNGNPSVPSTARNYAASPTSNPAHLGAQGVNNSQQSPLAGAQFPPNRQNSLSSYNHGGTQVNSSHDMIVNSQAIGGKKKMNFNADGSQYKSLNYDKFPQKPLSSQGAQMGHASTNLSVQMLSTRKNHQSLDQAGHKAMSPDDHSIDQPGTPQLNLKKQLEDNNQQQRKRLRVNQGEKRQGGLPYDPIQLPPMLRSQVNDQQPSSPASINAHPQRKSNKQPGRSVDEQIGKQKSRGTSGPLIGPTDQSNGQVQGGTQNFSTGGPGSPRFFAGQQQQPGQSQGRYTQNLMSPNGGFFTSRLQAINSSGGKVPSIDTTQTSSQGDQSAGSSAFSPRRQQNQLFSNSGQQVLHAIPNINTKNGGGSQGQKSSRVQSQQRSDGTAQSHDSAPQKSKPLSPTSPSDVANPLTPPNGKIHQRSPLAKKQSSTQNGDSGVKMKSPRVGGMQKSPVRQEPTGIEEEPADPNIQFVDVQSLLFGDAPLLNPKTIFLKNHEPTKASTKKCGHIKSYAANTNQGIIREYNEDRVSIILNILKPKNKQLPSGVEWPQVCFFGVFDGHGGSVCADYLRDNLHNFVVQNEKFPQEPEAAIVAGFRECEKSFIHLVEMAQARTQKQNPGQVVGPERSGTCAMCVIVINDIAHVVNVGDSRCIMSMDAGSQTAVLSRDHKPDCELERQRIQAAGGKVYRTQTFAKAAAAPGEKDLYVQGPLRVFPGRLSVSRTFGDIEAKRPRYGGNQNVIVCEPEVLSFKLKDNYDFFLIGCDGIFERLNNKQIIDCVWDRINEQMMSRQPDAISPPSRYHQSQTKTGANKPFYYDEHIAAAEGVEMGLRETAASRSLDNITILILGLKGLKKTIKKMNAGQTLHQVRQQIISQQRMQANPQLEDFFEVEINEADLYSNPESTPPAASNGGQTIDEELFGNVDSGSSKDTKGRTKPNSSNATGK